MSRPEADGGGGLPDEYHLYGDRHNGNWYEFDSDRSVQRHVRDDRGVPADRDDRGTENDVPDYRPNDAVKAQRNLGGVFGTNVPRGTRGRVVSTREGVFNSYVTVEFANGYTEEVRTDAVRRVRWFD